MAKTYTIDHPALEPGPNLEYFSRKDLEVDSSTFPLMSPLIDTSGNGLLGEAADPLATATLVGWAQQPGQNGTSKRVKWVIAFDGQLVYMNFLTNAGATNAIAATDKFDNFDVHMSAVHPITDAVASTDMFHASDSTADATVQMVSFQSDQNIAGQVVTEAVAADSDARVLFKVLDPTLLSSAQ